MSVAVAVALFVSSAPHVVGVAPLDGLGVDPALVETLSATVKKKVTDLGLDLVEIKDACSGDVACLAAAGKKAGANTVVAGSVGLVQDQLHIVLKQVDVVTAAETHTETTRATVDQAEARMRATALKLLDPQRYNTSGALVVRVNVSGAEIVVDGTSRGFTPLLGPIDGLTPGRREVEVRAPGASDAWRGFVDTPVDGVAQLELSVVNGKLVEGDVPVDPTPKPPAGISPMLIGGGAAATLGVVSLAAAGVFYANAWSTLAEIEAGNTSLEKQDQNASSVLAAGILGGLGVVGLAAGGTLIALQILE